MQDEVKVTQAAREAAENFMNAHGWLCEEEWTQVLEADREVIFKFFAKFEQSIRHQAERETLAAWNTRAVNSHHDLIEALRAVKAELQAAWEARTLPAECVSGETIRKINAALTKAEAGHG